MHHYFNALKWEVGGKGKSQNYIYPKCQLFIQISTEIKIERK